MTRGLAGLGNDTEFFREEYLFLLLVSYRPLAAILFIETMGFYVTAILRQSGTVCLGGEACCLGR